MLNGFIAVADLGVQSSNPADCSRFWSHLEPNDSSGYAVGKPEAWLELKWLLRDEK